MKAKFTGYAFEGKDPAGDQFVAVHGKSLGEVKKKLVGLVFFPAVVIYDNATGEKVFDTWKAA